MIHPFHSGLVSGGPGIRVQTSTREFEYLLIVESHTGDEEEGYIQLVPIVSEVPI